MDNWSVDALTRLRKHVESFGIALDAVPLPMSSSYITRAELPEILLAKDPERDRAIEKIRQMIPQRGRGRHSDGEIQSDVSWRRADGTRDRPRRRKPERVRLRPSETGTAAHEAGPISEEIYWDRITYFLKRVVPVAEEAKVRIALHPQDPRCRRRLAFAASTPCSVRSKV
jgi:mannonate dehydratase